MKHAGETKPLRFFHPLNWNNVMKLHFLLKILSVGLLLASCKSTGHKSSEFSSIEVSGSASTLHQLIVADLQKGFPSSKGTVWFESKMQLSPEWLVESPKDIWGRAEETLPKDVECKAGAANCDKQFTRYLCSTDSDCANHNTSCLPLEASVAKAGQAPRKMCLGASDSLLDRFYRVITSADKHLDITTLSLPTGRFYPMLVNALATLSHKNPVPTIRILTAGKASKSFNALNQPQDQVNALAADISKAGGKMDTLRIDFGFLSSMSALSWNHSKIIIADSNRVLQGGHNFYDPDYLEDHPVFDLSMEFAGPAATGVQSFVNNLWSIGKLSLAPFGRYPYKGGLDVLKPSSWAPMEVPSLQPTTRGQISMIGVGRLGSFGDNASDLAFLSLIRNAKRSIYIAQEDIFSKIPLTGVKDVQKLLKMNQSAALPTLVDAILDGKTVRIAQTDQAGDGLDGYGMMNAPEAQTYIVAALVNRAKERN
ncbi:MAG: phosphatidylserine/phosphatidylglycerophosphate/cardiolipin synthase family protein, partial [Proteobacteria bacterium]